MTRGICTAAAGLTMLAGRGVADPDMRDGMPEPLPASGLVSGTLLPLEQKRVHFAVVGDYGYLGPGAAAVAAMIRSWEPEFILTTGDNIYGPVDYYDMLPAVPGVQTGWDEYVGRYYGDWIQRRQDGRYESLTGSVQRFFPCVGNHEHTLLNGIVTYQPAPLPEESYRDFFHLNPGGAPRLPVDRGAVHTEYLSYYALRKGPVDFFIMDSNQPFLGSAEGLLAVNDQNAWLEREVAASAAPWKLAVFHHPPPRSFQVAWNWIPPSRMALCDAVLAGHVHVYERFLWNGVPVIVTGNGGAPIQPRAHPFFTDTLAVDDRRYGALLVQAGTEYVEFEARSLNLTTGEELLAERYVLGNAAAIPDMYDEYAFYADAGESVVFTTLNTSPALDPQLTLFDPDGRVAASDANGAGDGRNASLSAAFTRSGRWKLRIAPETDTGGAYQINAVLHRPGPGYQKWASRHPKESRGPSADGDSDGVPNLVAYALTPHDGAFDGAALKVSATPGTAVVRLTVPAQMRQGVTLALESSNDPAAAVWATMAVRRPFEAWISPANAALNLFPGSPGRQLLQVVMPSGDRRRCFRLRASLLP